MVQFDNHVMRDINLEYPFFIYMIYINNSKVLHVVNKDIRYQAANVFTIASANTYKINYVYAGLIFILPYPSIFITILERIILAQNFDNLQLH